ncbi:high mobility group nucleosome-binding domain-containing protein 5-like [Olea europaea var. sylvestris]|uniref:high mobility group nucleosome-binding domain-containing protein 5-like n=1 Tax=Olea europaea var. sylvestris TaxID=158386 RepID=UPI000C1D46B6|nr:high mobility group nucleosome-binding domain-containing protein 5-like [Olea europaea var. sylvestris]
MGCGESKHAVATENAISKSKRKNSNSNIIAENSVEGKEKLNKEPGVDVNVEVRENLEGEKEKENAKVIDNGNVESGMEENEKGRENSEDGKENAKVEEEIQGANAKVTDNGNGKSEEENVKEKERKLEAAVVTMEENKEGKSGDISVHQVQEPEEENLKREMESIIPDENASEGKIDLNDDVEGKEFHQEAKEESKTEDDIKVEEEKEVIEVVLPKDSATKGE